MAYSVKELVYTLQGEGAHCGRAAVFCRFAGCNLWSGREVDRADAACQFCDTDFVGTDGQGGDRFTTPTSLADAIAHTWRAEGKEEDKGCRKVDSGNLSMQPSIVHSSASTSSGTTALAEQAVTTLATGAPRPYVVFTGGEPALQLDRELIDAVHARGFEIAIETNGTIGLPAGIDWVCVSPKAGTLLRIDSGDELKLIYPQPGAEPEWYARLAFRHFFLQPLDGPLRAEHTRQTIAYCLAHPRWRISLQTHKILGIP